MAVATYIMQLSDTVPYRPLHKVWILNQASPSLCLAVDLTLSWFMKIASRPKSYDAFKLPAQTKLTQKRLLPARTPVMRGPVAWAVVLTTLMVPMMAVLSLGRSTAARNAERGATSMNYVHARRMRNMRENVGVDGTGMRARKMADGRCVKTIV